MKTDSKTAFKTSRTLLVSGANILLDRHSTKTLMISGRQKLGHLMPTLA